MFTGSDCRTPGVRLPRVHVGADHRQLSTHHSHHHRFLWCFTIQTSRRHGCEYIDFDLVVYFHKNDKACLHVPSTGFGCLTTTSNQAI